MQINMFKTHKEQIVAIIEELTRNINQSLKTQNNVTIALSGGKSPIELFRAISKLNLEWDRIVFTLVDERITNIDSLDSNEYNIKINLLQNHAQKAHFVGLYQYYNNIDQSINSSEIENKIPKIDVAILGMGEDGHFASIFSDCKEYSKAMDLQNRNKYLITNPNSAKYSRITLSKSGIMQIPNLILSINGDLKYNIFKECLCENNNYPISHVLNDRRDVKTYWYL